MERLDVLSVLAEGDGVAKLRKVSKAETETKAHAARTRGLNMPVWKLGFFFIAGFSVNGDDVVPDLLNRKATEKWLYPRYTSASSHWEKTFRPFTYVLRRIRRSVTRKVFFCLK